MLRCCGSCFLRRYVWPDRGAGGGGFSFGGTRRCRKINLRVRSQSAHLTIGGGTFGRRDRSSLHRRSGAAAVICAVEDALCANISTGGAWRAGRVTVSRPRWRDGGLTLFTVGTPTPELLGRLGLAPERLLVLAPSVGAEQVANGHRCCWQRSRRYSLLRPVQASVSSLAAAGVVCEQVRTVAAGLDDQDRPSSLLLQSAIGTRHRLPIDAPRCSDGTGRLYGFSAKELSVLLPARVCAADDTTADGWFQSTLRWMNLLLLS